MYLHRDSINKRNWIVRGSRWIQKNKESHERVGIFLHTFPVSPTWQLKAITNLFAFHFYCEVFLSAIKRDVAYLQLLSSHFKFIADCVLLLFPFYWISQTIQFSRLHDLWMLSISRSIDEILILIGQSTPTISTLQIYYKLNRSYFNHRCSSIWCASVF